jgi:hypothetical protein
MQPLAFPDAFGVKSGTTTGPEAPAAARWMCEALATGKFSAARL